MPEARPLRLGHCHQVYPVIVKWLLCFSIWTYIFVGCDLLTPRNPTRAKCRSRSGWMYRCIWSIWTTRGLNRKSLEGKAELRLFCIIYLSKQGEVTQNKSVVSMSFEKTIGSGSMHYLLYIRSFVRISSANSSSSTPFTLRWICFLLR